MSGNGRSTMRPQGRSPPFLVIGLLVALCILGFNYWNVSKKNGDYATQVGNCQNELRLVSEQKVSIEKYSSEAAQKLQENVDMVKTLKSQVQEKDNQVNTVNEQLKDKQNEINSCKAEFDSTKAKLTKAEQDMAGVQLELQRVQEDLKKKEGEKKPESAQCDANACADSVRNVLSILTKSLGKPAVISALQQNGVDMAKFADLPDQPGSEQKQEPQQQQQPQQQQPQQQQQQQPQPPVGQGQEAKPQEGAENKGQQEQQQEQQEQQQQQQQQQQQSNMGQPQQGLGQLGQGQPGQPGQGQPGQGQPGQGQSGQPGQGQLEQPGQGQPGQPAVELQSVAGQAQQGQPQPPMGQLGHLGAGQPGQEQGQQPQVVIGGGQGQPGDQLRLPGAPWVPNPGQNVQGGRAPQQPTFPNLLPGQVGSNPQQADNASPLNPDGANNAGNAHANPGKSPPKEAIGDPGDAARTRDDNPEDNAHAAPKQGAAAVDGKKMKDDYDYDKDEEEAKDKYEDEYDEKQIEDKMGTEGNDLKFVPGARKDSIDKLGEKMNQENKPAN